MDLDFIRRCGKILEHAGLILEEQLHLFENLADILEERQLILEVPKYIRNPEIILEHLPFY